MGVDIARAALDAGHRVVATARDATRRGFGGRRPPERLAVALDVTDPALVARAVEAALERFGRIDVLVNNAGNVPGRPVRGGHRRPVPGPDGGRTSSGPHRDARGAAGAPTAAVAAGSLPSPPQPASSPAPVGSAYAASKFALEGWTEALHDEVEPFGIRTTTVEPGFFRTELLVEGSSTLWPDLSIDDYAAATAQVQAFSRSMHAGSPATRRSSRRTS